jgi:hypothetical protein
MSIYYTSKEHRAFERMMQEKPGFDHFDSHSDSGGEDCRTCRSHRPNWEEQFCEYPECPYEAGRKTARASPKSGGGGAK